MIPVQDVGSGPAVLLVPGLAATARFFEPLAADLARDHRVVTVELPGHGRNAAGAAGTAPSLVKAATQIAETIAALKLRDVTLVGWSLGATVCYQLLSGRGRANVAALVSVEQTPRLIIEEDWPHGAFGGLDVAGAQQLLKDVADDPDGFAYNLVMGSFAAGDEPDRELAADLVAQARGCEPAAVRALLVEALVQDWRDWLTELKLPTLFVHGARSQVYPTDVGTWLEQAVEGSRLVRFEASGHLPFLEERERFAAVVRDFVAQRGSGGTDG